jgi:NAD(P)H-hydrate epimerase
LTVLAQLPEALVVGCGETPTGAIAALPDHLDLGRYQAIAWGPGLSTDATALVEPLLASPTPLLIDADGLNLLAPLGAAAVLARRSAPTLITPHPGEFRRLFPGLWSAAPDPGEAAQDAAAESGAVVLLKGACTAIAHPDRRLWFNPDSTPALARGGSGDLLTGLAGGLLAQGMADLEATLDAALAATWWHGTAARRLAQRRTVLGVDGLQLAAALGDWQLGED